MKEITLARFEVYRSEDQYFSHRFLASDFRIFKGKAYKTFDLCISAIKKIKKAAGLDSIYIRNRLEDRYFFNIRLFSGESPGISEMFNTEEDMNAAIALMKYEARSAPVIDKTSNSIPHKQDGC